jgi:uncharacterized protein YbjT (DUF2867 family)
MRHAAMVPDQSPDRDAGMKRVTVLAATGRLGQALLRQLVLEGMSVIAVGRSAARLAALPPGIETRVADLGDSAALTAALADAELVVSCANAQFVPAILAALPRAGVERLVLMGSTRRFSGVPDSTANAVRVAESALRICPIPSVLLLATLIYGGGAGVVEMLAAQIRRFPVLPLVGGAALVQPIHIDDVAAALVAGLVRPNAPGTPIVIAGPRPMPYRDMVRSIASARRLRLVLLPVPSGVVRAVARLAGGVGPLATIAGSMRRLLEDRSFDISDMRDRLGLVPREFAPVSSA